MYMNILDLRNKFQFSYTLELTQKSAILSFNVSNCLSIISYKIINIIINKIY
jgi:hypothetical protein